MSDWCSPYTLGRPVQSVIPPASPPLTGPQRAATLDISCGAQRLAQALGLLDCLEFEMSTLRSILVLAASTTLLVGCSKSTSIDNVSYSAVHNNLSPEVNGLVASDYDNRSNNAIIDDLNERMMHDDWNRFWLRDKPSMLTPYPVISTNRDP